MGGQLATGSSIFMASAGVPAADSAGLSSVKSYAQLLTAIAGAPLASPTFTGTPAAPTATPGTNTTQIATTAFVTAAVSGGSYLASSGGTLTGNLLFSADNTHTIGASGATRPSAIHVGTGGVTSAGVINCPNGSNYIKIDSANNRIELYRAAVTQSYIQAAAATNAVEITTGLITGGNAKITGRIAATGALRSGSESGVSDAAGVLDLWSPVGGDCFVAWTQSGAANRGVLGFSAGSGTLRYRSAATSMSTGTEVFAIGSTGNVTCAGITASAPVSSGVYTFATVPTASSYTGSAIRISDRSQKWAYSDGTDWRFFVDGAVIS